jgi:hypothetical protein
VEMVEIIRHLSAKVGLVLQPLNEAKRSKSCWEGVKSSIYPLDRDLSTVLKINRRSEAIDPSIIYLHSLQLRTLIIIWKLTMGNPCGISLQR